MARWLSPALFCCCIIRPCLVPSLSHHAYTIITINNIYTIAQHHHTNNNNTSFCTSAPLHLCISISLHLCISTFLHLYLYIPLSLYLYISISTSTTNAGTNGLTVPHMAGTGERECRTATESRNSPQEISSRESK